VREGDSSATTYGALLADDFVDRFTASTVLVRSSVQKELDALPPKHRNVLIARANGRTLNDIGVDYIDGCSRERVR
jgi:hypothetical protein